MSSVQTYRDVDLSEKVAHLSRPDAFPDGPQRVQAVETHFAWVFLSRRFVYKLKKPVRSSEFDLTTVQARRVNCELEIALNRRLAPETYIGVVPLGRRGRLLRLECDAHPVDWLVKMRRLPAEITLEHLLPDMRPSDPRLALLLATLCDFYRRAARAPWNKDEYIRTLEQSCRGDAERLMLPALEPQHARIRDLAEQQLAFVAAHRELLEDRVHERRIRDAHGDLRPEHVFLTEPPQIIDCLEFSAELRQLDAAEEIGFLALECERLGRADIGARLIELYAASCDDHAPRHLFDFYLSRRAALRAYLSIWHVEDGLDDGRARHWTDQALWYVNRAATAIEGAAAVGAGFRSAAG